MRACMHVRAPATAAAMLAESTMVHRNIGNPITCVACQWIEVLWRPGITLFACTHRAEIADEDLAGAEQNIAAKPARCHQQGQRGISRRLAGEIAERPVLPRGQRDLAILCCGVRNVLMDGGTLMRRWMQ